MVSSGKTDKHLTRQHSVHLETLSFSSIQLFSKSSPSFLPTWTHLTFKHRGSKKPQQIFSNCPCQKLEKHIKGKWSNNQRGGSNLESQLELCLQFYVLPTANRTSFSPSHFKVMSMLEDRMEKWCGMEFKHFMQPHLNIP